MKPLERTVFTITEGVFFEVNCKIIDHEEYINSSHLEWEWNKMNIENGTVDILNRSKSQSVYNASNDGNLFIIRTKSSGILL